MVGGRRQAPFGEEKDGTVDIAYNYIYAVSLKELGRTIRFLDLLQFFGHFGHDHSLVSFFFAHRNVRPCTPVVFPEELGDRRVVS